MKRGELVTVALSGAYGKPRPALVVQADLYSEHPSVTVLPLTSEMLDAPLLRITLHPSAANGLQSSSLIMVDKAVTVPRAKVGGQIGCVDAATMAAINPALAAFLDLD